MEDFGDVNDYWKGVYEDERIDTFMEDRRRNRLPWQFHGGEPVKIDWKECACEEETDPNLVLHGPDACVLRSRRLVEGDTGYVPETLTSAADKRLHGQCKRCGEPEKFHAKVKHELDTGNTSFVLICANSIFEPYR